MNTEQLYQDFTTKLMPKIADGLTITKEYFTDLFGRYVKYLIMIDGLYVLITFLTIITGIIIAIKGYKIGKTKDWNGDGFPEFPLILISTVILIIGSIIFFCEVNKLIKDIYIPEIRIYEELNYLKR
ncbi:MAG: hypothetical protein WCX88_04135 [Patescibacteria group bacterium]